MGKYGMKKKDVRLSTRKSTILRTKILELEASSIMYDLKKPKQVNSPSLALGYFLQIHRSYMITLSSMLQLSSRRMHMRMLVDCEPSYEYSGMFAESGANAPRKFSFILRKNYGTTISHPKKNQNISSHLSPSSSLHPTSKREFWKAMLL